MKSRPPSIAAGSRPDIRDHGQMFVGAIEAFRIGGGEEGTGVKREETSHYSKYGRALAHTQDGPTSLKPLY